MTADATTSWPTVPLGTVLVDIQPGFASGRHNSTGQGIPHFRPMNVSPEGRIDRSILKYVDPTAGRPELRLHKGDVVFNNTNSPELVGKTAVFEDDDAPAFSNHMTRLRTDPAQLDPGYLALKLHQAWREGWFAAHCNNHVSQASIGREVLKALEIELPPLAVQREIDAYYQKFDSYKSLVSGHIVLANRAIEQSRQAILAVACSGRLTTDWRETNPQAAVEPGPGLTPQARANTSGSPNTSDLIAIPDTWAWWTIEGITDQVIDYRGRTPPSEKSGPIPHVRTTQIRLGHIDWNVDRFITRDVYDKYMTRGIPQRGDVLFTMEAPLGEVGIIDRDEPFSIAQRILLLRPGEGLTSEFLALALQSQPVRRAIEYRATGSGVMGIAYKRLRSVLLPKPPVEEQLEIVHRAGQLLEITSSVEERISHAERSVGRTSQAMLAKAFRGDLTVGISSRTR